MEKPSARSWPTTGLWRWIPAPTAAMPKLPTPPPRPSLRTTSAWWTASPTPSPCRTCPRRRDPPLSATATAQMPAPLTSAPNYTEAGDYPVYYEITYTYHDTDMVEDGVAYVHLRDETTTEDGSCTCGCGNPDCGCQGPDCDGCCVTTRAAARTTTGRCWIAPHLPDPRL